MRRIRVEVGAVYESVIRNLSGAVGARLRRSYWKSRLRVMGDRVTIGVGVLIKNPGCVEIHSDTWIDDRVTIIAGETAPSQYVARKTSDLVAAGDVIIGERVHIAPDVLIQGHGGVWIGDETGIASGSKLYSLSNHYRHRDAPGRMFVFSPMVEPDRQAYVQGPVIVRTHAAVGLCCILLPGADVASDSWLGSMSVLSTATVEHSVYAGNPAVMVKHLTETHA